MLHFHFDFANAVAFIPMHFGACSLSAQFDNRSAFAFHLVFAAILHDQLRIFADTTAFGNCFDILDGTEDFHS